MSNPLDTDGPKTKIAKAEYTKIKKEWVQVQIEWARRFSDAESEIANAMKEDARDAEPLGTL